jgi:hypothetical protein
MWATDKKVKMMNQMEIEGQRNLLPSRMKNIKSIEGRVVVLCLSTWFFGYVLT